MYVRLTLLAMCVIALATFAQAKQSADKPYRIMMILYRGQTEAEKGFKNYFERRHIPVEYIERDAQYDKTKIADFVREARELKPDLIYTFGTTVTEEVAGLDKNVDAARNITDTPIVFDIVADPKGAELVRNLKSSGRNLTGASHLVPLSAQMNALEAMRKTERLGVIYNPHEQNSLLAIKELQQIAGKFNLSLALAPVASASGKAPTASDVTLAMRDLLAKHPQFIYVPSDSFMITNARVVVQAAQTAGVPVFSATEAPIREDGALLGLVSNYYNVGELAASKAEQILVKKTPAARIPIETLNRFTYLVNMEAAKNLGVYPPVSVVKFAELISPLANADARE